METKQWEPTWNQKPGTEYWEPETEYRVWYTGKQQLGFANQDTGHEILEAGHWILEARLVPESEDWESNKPIACWAGFSVSVRKSKSESKTGLHPRAKPIAELDRVLLH